MCTNEEFGEKGGRNDFLEVKFYSLTILSFP